MIAALAYPFAFSGRIDRAEFFWLTTAALLVLLAPGLIAPLVSTSLETTLIAGTLGLIAHVWMALSACARRLRDIERSPWWAPIALIPILGVAFALWLWAVPGASGQAEANGALEPGEALAPSDRPASEPSERAAAPERAPALHDA